MHPAELSRGPASSRSTWSAADSIIDQNAALWASLRPPARPSWPVLVRQRVSELSLASVGGRLDGVSRWLGTRETARRWLLSATGGIVLGLALGVAARFSESSPPELEDPPIAALPAASPSVAAEPVAAPAPSAVQNAAVQNAAVQSASREAVPAALAPEAPPELGPDAPKLAEPAPAKRAVASKKKKPGASAKRRARKSASKRKRSVTPSR